MNLDFISILLRAGLNPQYALNDIFATDTERITMLLLQYGARATAIPNAVAPQWAIAYEREIREMRTACAERMYALRWCMARRGCPHDMARYFVAQYVAAGWLVKSTSPDLFNLS